MRQSKGDGNCAKVSNGERSAAKRLGEGGQNGRVFWSHWDSWLSGSSYGISRNRAVPFATTDFVGAFAGA
jgi:hypothetical protein